MKRLLTNYIIVGATSQRTDAIIYIFVVWYKFTTLQSQGSSWSISQDNCTGNQASFMYNFSAGSEVYYVGAYNQ